MKNYVAILIALASVGLTAGVAYSKDSFGWEGLWAQKAKAQCKCKTYSIDQCPAGNGLPPLRVTQKVVEAPELSCDIVKVKSASDDGFVMSAKCFSEGMENKATIAGTIDNGQLEITIGGDILNYWGQGNYRKFSVKCR